MKQSRRAQNSQGVFQRIYSLPKKDGKIVIVYRSITPEVLDLVEKICSWSRRIRKDLFRVYISRDQNSLFDLPVLSSLQEADLVISLGGDGTYLRAVRQLQGKCVPILGFHVGGRLGFLSPHRAHQAIDLLEHLVETDQKLILVPRSLLRLEWVGGGETSSLFSLERPLLALNDLVLDRGGRNHLIEVSMFSGGQLITSFRGDGLIVATPTGSTAYNLSAGGPIVHPSVEAFVITPICPHSLTHRPFLIPDKEVMEFQVGGSKGEGFGAHLSMDGQFITSLGFGDRVRVCRALLKHWMLRDDQSHYFDLLREKLQFGGGYGERQKTYEKSERGEKRGSKKKKKTQGMLKEGAKVEGSAVEKGKLRKKGKRVFRGD